MKKVNLSIVALILNSTFLILNCPQAEGQIISTFAGNGTAGYSGDGGNATAAELHFPTGVAIDAIGNLYIADNGNNRIRMITTSGVITTIAGNGIGYYSGDGASATSVGLYNPQGLVLDAAGNLYIADQSNHRIRKVTTDGIITTIAGNGTAAYSGDGGQATNAELYNPQGVTIDAVGNLYISDKANYVIRKVNTSGIISTFAGNGTYGYSGDGGAAIDAQLFSPEGAALDALGNLFIAEGGNNRIRMVNTLGIISTIAGNGTGAFSGDGGQATAAEFNFPNGVAFDAAGNLYIDDLWNNRIRIVNTAGIISTIAGNGTAGYSGDGGQATSAELYTPAGVVIDAASNMYIADYQNNRIRMVANCSSISNYPTVTYTLTADIAPHTWDAYPTYSPNVVSARWYWGDGKDTMALYPSHTYSVAGTYSICVAAYSACGDSAVSCQNDAVSRSGNNSPYSNMVYVNVLNGNQTTGIKQLIGNSEQVLVYPNPASTHLTLTLSKGEGTTTLQITDMLGNTVKQSIIYNLTSIINIADISEGIYNVSITTNEGVVNKRVVIVR